MAYNESDDEPSILAEISKLRQEVVSLDTELYLSCTKRRLINHRIADLEYELRNRKTHELENNN